MGLDNNYTQIQEENLVEVSLLYTVQYNFASHTHRKSYRMSHLKMPKNNGIKCILKVCWCVFFAFLQNGYQTGVKMAIFIRSLMGSQNSGFISYLTMEDAFFRLLTRLKGRTFELTIRRFQLKSGIFVKIKISAENSQFLKLLQE